MQALPGLTEGELEGRPYTRSVPRRAAPSKGSRPKQGARLLALRTAAGLTQIQLAEQLGVPHSNIAFWEWSDKPPRSDLLPRLARLLGCSVDDILGDPGGAGTPRRPGPVGKLQRVFEQARSLPRRDQELVAKFVATLVEQRKAS
jgi:transcriptional regulator with XRE-family HTH domain